MKTILRSILLTCVGLFLVGCAGPQVTQKYEENTTRTVEQNPRIGTPVRTSP